MDHGSTRGLSVDIVARICHSINLAHSTECCCVSQLCSCMVRCIRQWPCVGVLSLYCTVSYMLKTSVRRIGVVIMTVFLRSLAAFACFDLFRAPGKDMCLATLWHAVDYGMTRCEKLRKGWLSHRCFMYDVNTNELTVYVCLQLLHVCTLRE